MDTELVVRRAVPAEFGAVAALRLAAYRAAPEFTIADEAAVTRWDGAVWVVAAPGGELLATMQVVECATSAALARANGGGAAPAGFAALPTWLLNRGATLPGHHRAGLNSRLRLAVLAEAQADARVQSLTGFVYEGAPRLNLLRELGYGFAPVVDDGQFLHTFTTQYFVWLVREQFAAARAKLLNLVHSTLYVNHHEN